MAKEMSNNTHVCTEKKVNLDSWCSSFEKLPYTSQDFRRIFDFYVLHAPILKNIDEIGDGFELRCLVDYGWKTTSDLTKLEREMLKKSGITRFVLIKADTIKGILDDMNLEGDICTTHPRAVANQRHKLKVDEYGIMKNESDEKRLVCIFRHIRNSLAHNRVYLFDNNMILLEDISNDGKTVTARLLMNSQTLIDWISVVDKDHKFYPIE